MPYPWQDAFTKSGLNLATMSWPRIERYFRHLKVSSDRSGGNDKKRSRDDDDDQDSSSQNGNGKRRGRWNNNKKNGKKQRFNKGGNGGGNGHNGRQKEGCPFHGTGHSGGWDGCFGNPKSKNYREGYELPMPTGLKFRDKKVRFNGQGRATGDAHAVDNAARNNNATEEHHHLEEFGESE
jgi:hypothetical protein